MTQFSAAFSFPPGYLFRKAEVTDLKAICSLVVRGCFQDSGGINAILGFFIGLHVSLLLRLLEASPVFEWLFIPPLVITPMLVPLITLLPKLLHPEGLWLVEHDRQVVAYAQVDRRRHCAILGSLYVAPAHRRQGIGSDLVRSVAQMEQCPLFVFATPRSIGFYDRLGFMPAGLYYGYATSPQESSTFFSAVASTVLLVLP